MDFCVRFIHANVNKQFLTVINGENAHGRDVEHGKSFPIFGCQRHNSLTVSVSFLASLSLTFVKRKKYQ